jgi:ribose-phosphate pyrophosphokinase
MYGQLVLLGGRANPSLTGAIAAYLRITEGQTLVSSYADGETRVEVGTQVRGKDVFIVQPTSAPANHHIMEALMLVDACRRASAQTITLVLPYFGYARQDRKSAPRGPITAKLVADLLETAGVHRILALDLHNAAIQGFFRVPVDHVYAKPVFAEHFEKSPIDHLIVVSPDAGGVERARAYAKQFSCGLAIIDKRRDKPNESAVIHMIGDVHGKNCLLVDDLVDTGGSLANAAATLMTHGALSVRAAVTHGVLSGNAYERLEQSPLQELVLTDSIARPPQTTQRLKITEVSVARLLATAVLRIHTHDSVTSLLA